MADERTMTCIICPRGCRLKVTYEGANMLSCEGNFCPRGAKYAADEIKLPVRTLTTTVKTNSVDVPYLPVKTDKPIHKDKMFSAMKLAAMLTATVPIEVGQVICEDFTEEGINLVAGRKIEK